MAVSAFQEMRVSFNFQWGDSQKKVEKYRLAQKEKLAKEHKERVEKKRIEDEELKAKQEAERLEKEKAEKKPKADKKAKAE